MISDDVKNMSKDTIRQINENISRETSRNI